MPVVLALGMLRQKDYDFEAGLGYLAKPCLKKEKRRRRKRDGKQLDKYDHFMIKKIKHWWNFLCI
jgi:hypothetical protein